MTAYTAISDAQKDVASPITANLMTLLRDNPIAMFEGDINAPDLSMDAFEAIAAGTVAQYSDPSTYTTTSNAFIDLWLGMAFVSSGSVRVAMDLKSNGTLTGAECQVLKNGVTVATLTSVASSYVEDSIDVAVVLGDVIRLNFRHNFSQTASITNIELRTTGGRIYPFTSTPHFSTNT